MKYIVEVRYTGIDWADLIADMRSWLDRRQIKVEEFGRTLLGRGVAIRVAPTTRIMRRHLRLRFRAGCDSLSRTKSERRRR